MGNIVIGGKRADEVLALAAAELSPPSSPARNHTAPVFLKPTNMSKGDFPDDAELDSIEVDGVASCEDDGYFSPQERLSNEREIPVMPSKYEGPILWKPGEALGSGAFGKVVLGLNIRNGELMAVKQVCVEGLADADWLVLALQDEIDLMSGLRHDNIVRYWGTTREQNMVNIFMEYVPGGSIATLLLKFGRLNESVIRNYTRQILTGLCFLHCHRIVHRDIKGGNILVDNVGRCKLADFGASKRLSDMAVGSHHSLRGTPYWMAPEVIKQTGHGRQADVWSVGCTLIEMSSGKPPWSQYTSQVSAMFQIAVATEPPTFPANLSTDAVTFLRLCFQRKPCDRPNTVKLLQHPFVTQELGTIHLGDSGIKPDMDIGDGSGSSYNTNLPLSVKVKTDTGRRIAERQTTEASRCEGTKVLLSHQMQRCETSPGQDISLSNHLPGRYPKYNQRLDRTSPRNSFGTSHCSREKNKFASRTSETQGEDVNASLGSSSDEYPVYHDTSASCAEAARVALARSQYRTPDGSYQSTVFHDKAAVEREDRGKCKPEQPPQQKFQSDIRGKHHGRVEKPKPSALRPRQPVGPQPGRNTMSKNVRSIRRRSAHTHRETPRVKAVFPFEKSRNRSRRDSRKTSTLLAVPVPIRMTAKTPQTSPSLGLNMKKEPCGVGGGGHAVHAREQRQRHHDNTSESRHTNIDGNNCDRRMDKRSALIIKVNLAEAAQTCDETNYNGIDNVTAGSAATISQQSRTRQQYNAQEMNTRDRYPPQNEHEGKWEEDREWEEKILENNEVRMKGEFVDVSSTLVATRGSDEKRHASPTTPSGGEQLWGTGAMPPDTEPPFFDGRSSPRHKYGGNLRRSQREPEIAEIFENETPDVTDLVVLDDEGISESKIVCNPDISSRKGGHSSRYYKEEKSADRLGPKKQHITKPQCGNTGRRSARQKAAWGGNTSKARGSLVRFRGIGGDDTRLSPLSGWRSKRRSGDEVTVVTDVADEFRSLALAHDEFDNGNSNDCGDDRLNVQNRKGAINRRRRRRKKKDRNKLQESNQESFDEKPEHSGKELKPMPPPQVGFLGSLMRRRPGNKMEAPSPNSESNLSTSLSRPSQHYNEGSHDSSALQNVSSGIRAGSGLLSRLVPTAVSMPDVQKRSDEPSRSSLEGGGGNHLSHPYNTDAIDGSRERTRVGNEPSSTRNKRSLWSVSVPGFRGSSRGPSSNTSSPILPVESSTPVVSSKTAHTDLISASNNDSSSDGVECARGLTGRKVIVKSGLTYKHSGFKSDENNNVISDDEHSGVTAPRNSSFITTSRFKMRWG